MGVRETLVLDHFYVGVAADEFDLLLLLKEILKKANHSKSDVQGDSWEGLYIYSRTRAYFELLRERRSGGLGLCFSPISLVFTDAAKIIEELPEEDWKIGTRILTNGRKWYDWISTGNYPDIESQFFNAWIMKYHPDHADWNGPILAPTVDKFRRIRLTLGSNHVKEIERYSRWFPGERRFENRSIEFSFQDRDGYPFDVFIDLLDGDQRFEFRELEMKFDPNNCQRPLDNDVQMGPFTLSVDGETLRLSASRP